MARAKLQALSEETSQTAAVDGTASSKDQPSASTISEESGQTAASDGSVSPLDQLPSSATRHDSPTPPTGARAPDEPAGPRKKSTPSTERVPQTQPRSLLSATETSQRSGLDRTRTLMGDRVCHLASTDEQELSRWNDYILSDGAIKSLHGLIWRQLRSDVRAFVTNCFAPSCSWESLDETTRAKLTALTPKAAMFAESKAFRCARSLFEAWIWRILYDNLFSPDCVDKWLGEEWASFGRIQRALRGKLTDAIDFLYVSSHLSF
jgi:hypothetical protein